MQAKLPVLCFLGEGWGEVGSFWLGFVGVFDYSLASSHILHLTRRFMNVSKHFGYTKCYLHIDQDKKYASVHRRDYLTGTYMENGKSFQKKGR